jgi:leader peptidase (prepilin peptidase)/N-methyltransferase
MIAAWLGPALALLTLTLAVFATAAFALILIAAAPRKRAMLAAKLPFGSFICAAALYAVFEGEPLLTWYLHFYGIYR